MYMFTIQLRFRSGLRLVSIESCVRFWGNAEPSNKGMVYAYSSLYFATVVARCGISVPIWLLSLERVVTIFLRASKHALAYLGSLLDLYVQHVLIEKH